MKTINILLLSVIMFAASCFTAQAQLQYAEGRLTLDGAAQGAYKTTLHGNGLYLKSGSNFFQIDISSTKTRLAGHGDEVIFFNPSTNKYNSIRVQNVYYQSDARAKTDIQSFTSGSAVVSQLRPVTYRFIDGSVCDDEIGLLAQEVESILPGAVITDENGGKLINYNALIPVLIDAVKTLQAEVSALKAAQ